MISSRPHGRLFLCSRIKLVAYSPDSPDVFSVGICPKLLPDTVNHTLDLGIHTHRDVIPDCLINLSFGKYLSWMLCKMQENIKFIMRKGDLFFFHQYPALFWENGKSRKISFLCQIGIVFLYFRVSLNNRQNLLQNSSFSIFKLNNQKITDIVTSAFSGICR